MEVPQVNLHVGKDDKYIDIWLRFDVHYGHEEFQRGYYDKYRDWLKADPNRYDIWGGDNYELAIPTHDKFKYLSSQTTSPTEQWEDLEKELGFENDRHLIYIAGNHEVGRIIKSNHFYDSLDRLCDLYGIHYSRRNSFLQLRIHKLDQPCRDYVFYLSHGRSSAREADYPLKELIRKGIAHEADIVVVGHTHHNDSDEFYINEMDYSLETGKYTVQPRKILGLRAGSFLVNPEYVGSDRPRPTPNGNRILRLYTDWKGWESYENLDEWMMKNG